MRQITPRIKAANPMSGLDDSMVTFVTVESPKSRKNTAMQIRSTLSNMIHLLLEASLLRFRTPGRFLFGRNADLDASDDLRIQRILGTLKVVLLPQQIHMQ